MADVTQNDIIAQILDTQHRSLVLLGNAIDADVQDKAELKKAQQELVNDHTQILALTQQVSDLTDAQKKDLSDKLQPILDAANEALHKAQSATASEDPVAVAPLPEPTNPVETTIPTPPGTATVSDATSQSGANISGTVPGVVEQAQQTDGTVISPVLRTTAANPFEPGSAQ